MNEMELLEKIAGGDIEAFSLTQRSPRAERPCPFQRSA